MHPACTTRRISKEIERGAISIEARRYEGMPSSTDYSKHHAPDTSAANLLMNRQGHRWKARQQVRSPGHPRLAIPASVIDIMAKARALIDASPDDDDVEK